MWSRRADYHREQDKLIIGIPAFRRKQVRYPLQPVSQSDRNHLFFKKAVNTFLVSQRNFFKDC